MAAVLFSPVISWWDILHGRIVRLGWGNLPWQADNSRWNYPPGWGNPPRQADIPQQNYPPISRKAAPAGGQLLTGITASFTINRILGGRSRVEKTA